MRLVLAGVFAALATAVPAQASEIAVPVSVEFQEPVVCVTYPCYQPTPVVVCVWPEDAERRTCTPR
ncbi:MAG TPA: hypothetical protein VNQ77_09250 [Frankiaceae bacterium]|nr:hypothetical protein [Frankiaceae bacterium]